MSRHGFKESARETGRPCLLEPLENRLMLDGGAAYPALVVDSTGLPELRDVAMDADGDFLVVWTEGSSYNRGVNLFGRFFDAEGNSQDPAVSLVPNGVDYAAIAMDSNGGFVAAWSRYDYDLASDVIAAQRFDVPGVPLGPELAVGSGDSDGGPSVVSVGVDGDGDFLVVWGEDGYRSGPVHGRFFDAAGTARGDAFVLVAEPTAAQPSVAMDTDGDFVVTWYEDDEIDGNPNIVGQFFDATGASLGGPFVVADPQGDVLDSPRVAMDSEGDFLVIWQEGYDYIQGVFGRFFDITGNAQGEAFLLQDTVTRGVGVAMAADGDFVVALDMRDPFWWPNTIVAQRFDAEATPVGPELVVDFSGALGSPDVAMSADGDFVVVWQEDSPDMGIDGGLFGRFFDAEGNSRDPVIRLASNGFGEVAVAMDAAGNFVCARSTYDHNSWSIVGQLFDAGGVPRGEEFAVGPGHSIGDYPNMSVALDADGDFLVVWEGPDHNYLALLHFGG